MRTLNEIDADLIRINELIENSIDEHGEITPDVIEELVHWENAGGPEERDRKLDAYLAIIREKEMRAVAAKAQEEQWAKKKKSEERGANWYRDRVKKSLELAGETKFTTSSGRVIAIQKNGGEVPIEWCDDAIEKMSEGDKNCFLILNPMIDKKAVRVALEAGSPLSFAKLGEAGTHLRIR